MRFLPFILLLWPFAEIAVFIWVGGQIGILQTLALIVGAGLIGVMFVRVQGLRLLREIQREIDAGRVPTVSLVRGAMTALSGLLFLLPGFLSDVIALLFLLPPVQKIIAGWLAANVTVISATAGTRRRGRQARDVVDLDSSDYRRSGDSPWKDEGGTTQPPRIEGR